VGYFGLDSVLPGPCSRLGSSFIYNYRWARDYRMEGWNLHKLSTILGKTQQSFPIKDNNNVPYVKSHVLAVNSARAVLSNSVR